MIKQIKFADRIIGRGQPCFIIAEAGVNHDGSLKKAKLLVDIAKEAGADAVKFQTWKTENLMLENVPSANYQKRQTGETDQYRMAKRLELSYNDFKQLKGYCDSRGIMFLSTPADEESSEFLNTINVPAFKVGSGELNNHLFLRRIARFGKPMIISTGMSNLNEVMAAYKAVSGINKRIVVLHCTSNYPAQLNEVNLKAMQTIKDKLKVPVGYSDHTASLDVPMLAVYLGACVIEKHFTYDKNAKGPDHAASLDKYELNEMVKRIRTFEAMNDYGKEKYTKTIKHLKIILGNGVKEPTQNEIETAKVVRKNLVARVYVPRGKRLTEEMLDTKRTGGKGIPANEYSWVIGKITKKTIKPNDIIYKNILK